MKWFALCQNVFGQWIIVHPVFALAWSGSRWVPYDWQRGLLDQIALSNFATVEEAAAAAAVLPYPEPGNPIPCPVLP